MNKRAARLDCLKKILDGCETSVSGSPILTNDEEGVMTYLFVDQPFYVNVFFSQFGTKHSRLHLDMMSKYFVGGGYSAIGSTTNMFPYDTTTGSEQLTEFIEDSKKLLRRTVCNHEPWYDDYMNTLPVSMQGSNRNCHCCIDALLSGDARRAEECLDDLSAVRTFYTGNEVGTELFAQACWNFARYNFDQFVFEVTKFRQRIEEDLREGRFVQRV